MSSPFTSPSTSESDGLLTPMSDGVSISSTTLANTRFHDMVQQVGTIRLSQDVPLPSIEQTSTHFSGVVHHSRGTTYSRTPSVAAAPSAGSSEVLQTSHASFRTSESIDNRLGMSEVAAAIEGVGRTSDRPGVFLRPESSAVETSSSDRRHSRRRSSSRTNSARHDVRDEELSNDRFHEPSFQKAFSDAKRLMAELTHVLSSSAIRHEPDSTMRQLHERATDLARFHCPSTRTVGFVGDSGVGMYRHFESLMSSSKLIVRREK